MDAVTSCYLAKKKVQNMIWFDLVTPKSVMFFKPLIKKFESMGREVLITARESLGYDEVAALLRLHGIKFTNRGGFGGESLHGKLKASLNRQNELMEFIAEKNIEKLVCLCSVDANRVAFGLGIPIINFYDIPLSDYNTDFTKALPQARLTLPLSNRAFRPFMVPNEIFLRFGLEDKQIFEYPFLDVVAWLKDFKPNREFFDNFLNYHGLDTNLPTIVVREEEFKASYVKAKFPILYDGLDSIKDKINANIIIIPRYESLPLKDMFPYACVIDKKIEVQHLLAFSDLFIGGGGTLNSESCYFGTPTISTRSFISHYDKWLMDKGLMQKADSVNELVNISLSIISKRNETSKAIFGDMQFNIDQISKAILDDSI